VDKALRSRQGDSDLVQQRRAKFEDFVHRLTEYLRPHLGRIAYGNLRCEVCDGADALDEVSNVAIVYETPGGSTDQVNIAYDNRTGAFHLVREDHDINCQDPDRILEAVKERVRSVPDRRMASLQKQADRWLSEGQSRGEMFAEVNRLLQSGLRGGSITAGEMRDVIRYIVDKHTQTSGEPL